MGHADRDTPAVGPFADALLTVHAVFAPHAQEMPPSPHRDAQVAAVDLAAAMLAACVDAEVAIDEVRSALLDGAWRHDTALEAPEMAAPVPPIEVACRKGCAWCCAGATSVAVQEAELARVWNAVAGQPDGRGWRADACPALHPVDRVCQAYDVRPLVCRGFYSASAAACERIATTGEAVEGPVQTHGLLVLTFDVMSHALNGEAATSYDLKAGLAALSDGADDFAAVLELARLP